MLLCWRWASSQQYTLEIIFPHVQSSRLECTSSSWPLCFCINRFYNYYYVKDGKNDDTQCGLHYYSNSFLKKILHCFVFLFWLRIRGMMAHFGPHHWIIEVRFAQKKKEKATLVQAIRWRLRLSANKSPGEPRKQQSSRKQQGKAHLISCTDKNAGAGRNAVCFGERFRPKQEILSQTHTRSSKR